MKAPDRKVPANDRLLDYSSGSLGRRIRRSRFTRAVRSNPVASLGLFIVCIFVLVALFPGAFTRHDPIEVNLLDKLASPSSKYIFGADHLGRDLYARVVYGASVTLGNVLVVITIAGSIGLLVGSAAGYLGGWVDEGLMRVTDVFLTFPTFILAMAINTVLGRGQMQTMVAVAIAWWGSYARLTRSLILSVKYEEYVTAARTVGAGTLRVVTRHVLPNCFSTILVKMTMDIGFVALTTSGLSFLGLGVLPPTPEWGRMVNEGRNYLLLQWWASTFPGLALFLFVVGANLLGEIVRDWLDPSGINR
jgi:peptide/nickel transport system permease protein